MGLKLSKTEDTYISGVPRKECTPSRFNIIYSNIENSSDPRSPAACRTPIILQKEPNDGNSHLLERESNHQNTLDGFRKRLLKSFTYNNYDPRSPSLNFNRTPLVFEESLEKSLCLNDTFADLFVESRLPDPSTYLEQTESNANDDDVKQEEKVVVDLTDVTTAPKTPTSVQQKFDPRSPSVGVERTPIIFTDDDEDEANEDIMLERILATLSVNLNKSDNSSLASLPSQNLNVNLNNKIEPQCRPMNKHLDRVRGEKKTLSKSKRRISKLRASHQKIYEDQENQPMTPKLRLPHDDKNDSAKYRRTPLSHVRNRNGTHTFLRTHEKSANSIKKALAVSSFDGTLNTENQKVTNLRIIP